MIPRPCPTIVVRLVAVAILLLAAGTSAAVPTRVPFQGLLLDDASQPVTDLVDFDFELFDAVVGGSSLWSESHPAVSVVDGVYAVELGTHTPLTPAVVSGGVAFLEITVDGETLTPRQQLLSVPYALRADQVGTIEESYIEAIFQHFDFDGGGPSNLSAEEGLADVDGDGRPNFLDADNDGDGTPDELEVSLGTDVNVVNPRLVSTTPSTFDSFVPVALEVHGAGFATLSSVSFAGESVAPYAVSGSSFMVDVVAQSNAPTATLAATLANGESDSIVIDINVVVPDLASTAPSTLDAYAATSLEVNGQGLATTTTVAIAGESPLPYAVGDTGFTVDVTTPTTGSSVTLVATLGNGLSDSIEIPVQAVAPTITGFSPAILTANVPETLTITGSGFFQGMTVQVGTQVLVPNVASTTTLTVDVAGEPQGDSAVVLSHPNGTSASSTIYVLEPGLTKIVFVTGTVLDGDFTPAGADALCQNQAGIGGLPGTFRAWLSESSASSNPRSPELDFPKGVGPYIRTDGVTVALSWSDLTDGTLLAPIDRSHLGVPVSNPTQVWTGTNPDGTAPTNATLDTCSEWTVTSGGGDYGRFDRTDGGWSSFGATGCHVLGRLYCFQQ